MSAVAPLVIDTPIDWDQYTLTDDDLERFVSPASLVDKASAILHGNETLVGAPFPLPKVASQVRLRRGKFHVWAGINHHGKTTLLKQVQLGLVRAGEVPCMASLEETPEETFADIAQLGLGMWVNENDKLRSLANLLHRKLWLYDQASSMTENRVLALMAYAAKEYGCTHFVIDGLTKLAIDYEDNDVVRTFCNRLCTYAKLLKVGVHLVCHIRKPKDETQIPSMMDIKGSGSITDVADSVFVVWRDKSESRQPTDPAGMLVVEKQRGRPNWIGRVRLWRELTSGQFIGAPGDDPQWFMPVDRFK